MVATPLSDPFAVAKSADARLPAVRRLCSADLGWQSVLARSYVDEPTTDEFSTAATPNQLIVMVTSGTYAIEERDGGRWGRATYRRGSIGLTSPGQTSVLRWRSLSDEPMRSLQLYLDPALFADGAESLRTPRLPDALSVESPVVASIGRALHGALETGAPGLYADTAAQFLAVHLMTTQPERTSKSGARGLGPTVLRDVVSYMQDNLADDLSLDDLSSVARMSKYHFLRQFRTSTGVTPFKFLTEIRMNRAADLLCSTTLPVHRIALRCGYRNASHFAAEFRNHHDTTPQSYRGQVR